MDRFNDSPHLITRVTRLPWGIVRIGELQVQVAHIPLQGDAILPTPDNRHLVFANLFSDRLWIGITAGHDPRRRHFRQREHAMRRVIRVRVETKRDDFAVYLYTSRRIFGQPGWQEQIKWHFSSLGWGEERRSFFDLAQIRCPGHGSSDIDQFFFRQVRP
jgi:hypothetical protein